MCTIMFPDGLIRNYFINLTYFEKIVGSLSDFDFKNTVDFFFSDLAPPKDAYHHRSPAPKKWNPRSYTFLPL